jgi:sarcosine oxidase
MWVNCVVYDAIVVGIGGMGSATTWQLARRGCRVLGLEAFDIPNAMGSSHGITRIIRLPYYESPAYVPLLKRAYELWGEIEAATDTRLLHITGSIDASNESAPLFQGALHAARLHDLDHEILSGSDVNRRFPGYQLPDDFLALFQPMGGFIASERAIVAHVKAAQDHGAEVHARERVTGWKAHPGGEGVVVTTDHGRYEAASLVLTAGAWMGQLVTLLETKAIPERQVLAWLQPHYRELFSPDRFPVFNIQVEEGRYYGLPVFDVPGFKFGRYHHMGESGSVDSIKRDADQRDESLLRAFAQRYFPKGCGPTMGLRTCLFTNAPDEHFIIDLHPEHKQVVLASPCSGHGYKFCSVIGEILANLAMYRRHTGHDIAFLGLSRFAPAD